MTRYEINQHIRKLLKLSSTELAKRVEVTRQNINYYERGVCRNRPTERVIEIELDLEIERCTNEKIKSICEDLKLERMRGLA